MTEAWKDETLTLVNRLWRAGRRDEVMIATTTIVGIGVKICDATPGERVRLTTAFRDIAWKTF